MEVFLALPGGFLGAVTRYCVYKWIKSTNSSFLFDSLTTNYIGSFITGILLPYSEDYDWVKSFLFPFMAVGFCGSFASFSNYAYDIVTQFESKEEVICGVIALLIIIIGSFLLWYVGLIISCYLISKFSSKKEKNQNVQYECGINSTPEVPENFEIPKTNYIPHEPEDDYA